MNDSNLVDPHAACLNVAETFRSEAMGFVLAVIDSARTLCPPAGMSASDALDQFATLTEEAAAAMYGTDWADFVALAHNTSARRHA